MNGIENAQTSGLSGALPSAGLRNSTVESATLEWTKKLRGRTLEVVTENSGTIRVGFASQQERDSAVATMVELEPRLGIQSSPPL